MNAKEDTPSSTKILKIFLIQVLYVGFRTGKKRKSAKVTVDEKCQNV